MSDVFPLHDGSTVCVFDWPDNYGVVTVTKRELVCFTCKRNSRGCDHVMLLHCYKEHDDPPSSLDVLFSLLDSSETSGKSHLSPSVVSFKKIPSDLSDRVRFILNQGGVQHVMPLTDCGEVQLQCLLPTDRCTACNNLLIVENKRKPLITENTSLYAQGENIMVMNNICCSMEYHFEGVCRLRILYKNVFVLATNMLFELCTDTM